MSWYRWLFFALTFPLCLSGAGVFLFNGDYVGAAFWGAGFLYLVYRFRNERATAWLAERAGEAERQERVRKADEADEADEATSPPQRSTDG